MLLKEPPKKRLLREEDRGLSRGGWRTIKTGGAVRFVVERGDGRWAVQGRLLCERERKKMVSSGGYWGTAVRRGKKSNQGRGLVRRGAGEGRGNRRWRGRGYWPPDGRS
uniref:Uncharacterized protein n=1 Tax=Populus davidiana TaxID=266767 RepID=A0A6M2EZX8_9ROSI